MERVIRVAAYCTPLLVAHLIDDEVGIEDADVFEFLDQNIVLNHIGHRADTDSQQGRFGRAVLVNEGVRNSRRSQDSQAAFGIRAVTEGADLDKDLVRIGDWRLRPRLVRCRR